MQGEAGCLERKVWDLCYIISAGEKFFWGGPGNRMWVMGTRGVLNLEAPLFPGHSQVELSQVYPYQMLSAC